MERPLHFIEHIIEEDFASGFAKQNLRFRFPPEPNGYLTYRSRKSNLLKF